jgi:aspartate/methionine/tyrosine aminotransferase
MVDFNAVDREFLSKRAFLKWGRWGEGFISLSVADADFPPPEEVDEEIRVWIEQKRTPYSHPQGEPELREALSEKIKSQNHIDVSAEDILVIPGTMFAIFLICYLVLRPGDEALVVPSPVYGPFWSNVKAAGARPIGHDVVWDGHIFDFDPHAIEEKLTERTRLLMICNPHNPCGMVMKREWLDVVADAALRHDLWIFSDELYEDMVFDGTHISIASLGREIARRCFTVFGFSKAFGMSGYRVAYMVMPPKWKSPILEAASRIMVHTDTLAQAAAMGALKAADRWLNALRDHLDHMRHMAWEGLNEIPGIRCALPQATPFLFPDVSQLGMTSDEFKEYLMKEAKVVVQSGRKFGPSGEGFVRLNVATSPDILEEALHRMKSSLGALNHKNIPRA